MKAEQLPAVKQEEPFNESKGLQTMLTRAYPPAARCSVTICNPSGHILAAGVTSPGQEPEDLARDLWTQAHPVYVRFKLYSNVIYQVDGSLYGRFELEVGRDGADGIVWLDEIVMLVDPVLS